MAEIKGVRKTSDLINCARKASREAESVMNEVAARLTDARSKLNVATSTSMKLHERAALEKSWLREHTHVRLTGDSEEHKKLRLLLDDLGPQKLIARKLAEVERMQAGLDADTIADELGLQALAIEVGRLGKPNKPRFSLKVRDQVTGQICLEWQQPSDDRRTHPAASKDQDPLTQKLHSGTATQAAPPGIASNTGSATSGSNVSDSAKAAAVQWSKGLG